MQQLVKWDHLTDLSSFKKLKWFTFWFSFGDLHYDLKIHLVGDASGEHSPNRDKTSLHLSFARWMAAPLT